MIATTTIKMPVKLLLCITFLATAVLTTFAAAWSHREEKNDEGEQFVAVLEIPPVDSAKKAVQVQIVKDVKAGKK